MTLIPHGNRSQFASRWHVSPVSQSDTIASAEPSSYPVRISLSMGTSKEIPIRQWPSSPVPSVLQGECDAY